MYLVVHAPPDRKRWARIVRQVRGPLQTALPVLGVVILVAEIVLTATGYRAGLPITAATIACGVSLCVLPVMQWHQLRNPTAPVNGDWTYVVTDAGITAQSATMRNELSWAALPTARETATDFLFFLAKNHVVAIPRERMPGHAQAELSAFLRARGLLR